MHKFKAKDSKINAAPLCLRNVSKDFLANNMKKLDFMVIFTILVQIMMLYLLMTQVLDIHKYLIKKNGIK